MIESIDPFSYPILLLLCNLWISKINYLNFKNKNIEKSYFDFKKLVNIMIYYTQVYSCYFFNVFLNAYNLLYTNYINIAIGSNKKRGNKIIIITRL